MINPPKIVLVTIKAPILCGCFLSPSLGLDTAGTERVRTDEVCELLGFVRVLPTAGNSASMFKSRYALQPYALGLRIQSYGSSKLNEGDHHPPHRRTLNPKPLTLNTPPKKNTHTHTKKKKKAHGYAGLKNKASDRQLHETT